MQKSLDALTTRLIARLRRASLDHRILEPYDHILVCLSGGKDSYTMLALLRQMQRSLPFDLKLTALHLDQRQPGYPEGVMKAYLEEIDVPHVVLSEDTYSMVTDTLDEDATPCSLCSRLRRGIIYTEAERLGCNKIALGHHRDDSIETLMLNLIYSGQLQAMPARYTTDDGRFHVVRPLIYCAQETIAAYADLMDFPIIPCNLCGSHEGQRKWVKGLLTQIEDVAPHARNSMLAALQNVRTTHLLDVDLRDALADVGQRADVDDDDDILRLVTNQPATG